MRSAANKLAEIENNEYVLSHMINSKLVKWICSGLNFNSTFKANNCKSRLITMHTLMYQIQGDILERLGKRVDVAASLNRYITESLK